LENVFAIALNFDLNGSIESIRAHGSGNVNDTYLVTLQERAGHAILQRVNTYVFKNPEAVMRNMQRATEHLQRCVREDGLAWQVQQVIPSKNGEAFHVCDDGSFWRMISYIEHSESFDAIYSHDQAYEIGFALGLFHELINRVDHQVFKTVLPGFHVSPGYLKAFDRAVIETDRGIDEELRFALDFVETHRGSIGVLEQARQEGALPLRVIHGDPKANNIMFHKDMGKAISVIDLDTIQPGLVHYDIGDCIRSSCNPLGEEPGVQWRDTTFDLDSFRHVLDGYLQRGNRFLSQEEYGYIYDAIFLMTFELGLRFLTDYLRGDVYYKIHFPSQNKYRALTQFKLAQEIHNHREAIEALVAKLQR